MTPFLKVASVGMYAQEEDLELMFETFLKH